MGSAPSSAHYGSTEDAMRHIKKMKADMNYLVPRAHAPSPAMGSGRPGDSENDDSDSPNREDANTGFGRGLGGMVPQGGFNPEMAPQGDLRSGMVSQGGFLPGLVPQGDLRPGMVPQSGFHPEMVPQRDIPSGYDYPPHPTKNQTPYWDP